MYDTAHPATIHDAPAAGDDLNARLNWLLAANDEAAQRRRLFRNALEEEQMLLMRHPLSTEQAYALFGMLLGTLPPAAIFIRLFGGELTHPYFQWGWFFLLLLMNVLCCLAGRFFGRKLGWIVDIAERDSWTVMFFRSAMIGAVWGICTGATGGFIFYVIGTFVGAAYAFPVGMLAYALFTPLHRLLTRGGMIAARHFWPLACGVTMVIAALILGL